MAPSSLVGCYIHLVRRTDGEIKTVVARAELLVNVVSVACVRTTVGTQIAVYSVACGLDVRLSCTHHTCQSVAELAGGVVLVEYDTRLLGKVFRVEHLVVTFHYGRIGSQKFGRYTYTFLQILLGISHIVILAPCAFKQTEARDECLHDGTVDGIVAIAGRLDVGLSPLQVVQDVFCHLVARCACAVQGRVVVGKYTVYPWNVAEL